MRIKAYAYAYRMSSPPDSKWIDAAWKELAVRNDFFCRLPLKLCYSTPLATLQLAQRLAPPPIAGTRSTSSTLPR